jgi:hypothetical protein
LTGGGLELAHLASSNGWQLIFNGDPMAKILTRYFETVSQAQMAIDELVYHRRVSERILQLCETSEALVSNLEDGSIGEATVAAYHKRLLKGGAVLIVRAGYKPLGVAQIVREVTSRMGAVNLGDLIEEAAIPNIKKSTNSILSDHPHMLTPAKSKNANKHYMANWPIPLISRREPFTGGIIEPHARMADFPIPLISRRKPFTGSIFPRHARMANFPIPLISRRKPFTGSIFPRHARMANFPIPLISRRKPFTGSIFPRHARMASVPFPLLINGKSKNSLMPNGPRMANFPISLLSKRKPYKGSIFPRHARMANFPIPLISDRRPFTGSIFPRHARMANLFLPLISRDSKETGQTRFSFSKLLGLPTIIKR